MWDRATNDMSRRTPEVVGRLPGQELAERLNGLTRKQMASSVRERFSAMTVEVSW